MTDSDVKTAWVRFPDARHYEADALSGNIRSLPRTYNGRHYPGADPLKPRPDPDGYLRINYRDDKGVRHHGASVARCVLMAHDPGGYFEGAEACHGPGGRQDNRLSNLRWDTPEANRIEALETRLANTPLKPPKPPKVCPRCGAKHHDKGRNCHPCVMKIGVDGAAAIVAGVRPDKVQADLDYPFIGVVNLAVTYGGLRFYREGDALSPLPRSRRVLFGRKASRRNSDGQ